MSDETEMKQKEDKTFGLKNRKRERERERERACERTVKGDWSPAGGGEW